MDSNLFWHQVIFMPLRPSRLLFKYSFSSNPYHVSTISIRKKLTAYSLNRFSLGVRMGRQ